MNYKRLIAAVIIVALMGNMSIFVNAAEPSTSTANNIAGAEEMIEQMITDLEAELSIEADEDVASLVDEGSDLKENGAQAKESKAAERQERLAKKQSKIEQARETQKAKQAAREERVRQAQETRSEKLKARDKKAAKAEEIRNEKQAERDVRIAKARQTRLDRQAARDAKLAMLEELKSLQTQVNGGVLVSQDSILDELVLMQEELQILSEEI